MRRMADTLQTVLPPLLPAGVTSEAVACGGARPSDTEPIVSVDAFTEMSSGGERGVVHVSRFRVAAGASGDLCATMPGSRIAEEYRPDALNGPESDCTTTTVNNAAVRLATTTRDSNGHPAKIYTAVRYADGWLVLAAEFPYTYRMDGTPELSQRVLTPQHLATIAVDPGFLP